MNRFITIENEQGCFDMINAQHIITVENMYDGKLQLRMVNGMKYTVGEIEWNNISGHNHIVQVQPCDGIAAQVNIGGVVQQRPVAALAVTASGRVRPINAQLQFVDTMYGTSYLGLVPGEN